MTLTILSAGLAGCIGGEDDNEEKTINIAGSSTVYPVASAWAQAYSASNADYTVTVAGGGSGAGASKVCSTDADSVHIGDMSRDWKSSEATVGEDGYTFSCLSSDITVTQLIVAIDGLSVVVKKGGAADQCISAMGGLSMAQLRWVFTDWSEEDLANHEKGGLDMNSTTPSNDDDGVREWSDLDDSSACLDNEIKLWGADSDSGTYEYFGEQVFCKNCFADAEPVAEGFDTVTGNERLYATTSGRTKARLLKEQCVVNRANPENGRQYALFGKNMSYPRYILTIKFPEIEKLDRYITWDKLSNRQKENLEHLGWDESQWQAFKSEGDPIKGSEILREELTETKIDKLANLGILEYEDKPIWDLDFSIPLMKIGDKITVEIKSKVNAEVIVIEKEKKKVRIKLDVGDNTEIIEKIHEIGLQSLSDINSLKTDTARVFLDGKLIGYSDDGHNLVDSLRELRRSNKIHAHIGISIWDPDEKNAIKDLAFSRLTSNLYGLLFINPSKRITPFKVLSKT